MKDERPSGEVLAYLQRSDKRSHLGLIGDSVRSLPSNYGQGGLGGDESFTGHSKSIGRSSSLVPMPILFRHRKSNFIFHPDSPTNGTNRTQASFSSLISPSACFVAQDQDLHLALVPHRHYQTPADFQLVNQRLR